MKIHIISILPNVFNAYFNESIIKKAQKNKAVEIIIHNLRDYTFDNRKTVDDTPFGGGAGMVLMIEPLYRCLMAIKENSKIKKKYRKVILLSAKGELYNQKKANNYSELKELVFICGRYEGVDERLVNFIDEEVSIGKYVLTGGELGSMVIVDSVVRLLPGVLGNSESALDESYSEENVLEYPQYTKPAIAKLGSKKYGVPEVLLSGNHQAIASWRKDHKKILK